MTELAVRLEGVTKRYRHFSLDDLHVDLPTGSILGLVGANGAGKSTTIRIIMGLVRHDRGTVEVLGCAMPGEQVAARRQVGFVSEDVGLYKRATLGWHMGFVRSIYPGWDDRYAESRLRAFDLRADQKVKTLSHGQRVKAALLLALSHRPRLLVLDEPTSGLDPLARQEVLAEIAEVLSDERRTVLFSSQNTMDIEQISDRIVFLDRGRIVASGEKEGLLDRWRRIRLELAAGAELPAVPGVVAVNGGGRLPVVVTDRFEPGLTESYRNAGATVRGVEPMTLEEIFIAEVHSRRADGAAGRSNESGER